KNHLQQHPRYCATIDFRSLDRRGRNAAQVEQRKSERRMHEARLDVGADQHPEPDEVDAEPVGSRGKQRDDDEGDLEEIEKERDHEDESIDEDEKTDLATRQ